MVGDGADGQGPPTAVGSVHIESGGFHFYGQHTHTDPLVVVGVHVVEYVRREHVAHHVAIAEAVAGIGSATQQAEIGNGCILSRHFILIGIAAVGAGTLCDDQVAHMQIGIDASCRSHADDLLHAIEVEQFVTVDTDAGQAHSVPHHADALSIVHTSETKHVPHLIEQDRILQKLLRHKLRAEWVARHDDGLSNFAILCPDVGRWCLTHKAFFIIIKQLLIPNL